MQKIIVVKESKIRASSANQKNIFQGQKPDKVNRHKQQNT